MRILTLRVTIFFNVHAIPASERLAHLSVIRGINNSVLEVGDSQVSDKLVIS